MQYQKHGNKYAAMKSPINQKLTLTDIRMLEINISNNNKAKMALQDNKKLYDMLVNKKCEHI